MAPATPKEQVYHIHPSGWENDPEEERFKLSLFDPIILVVYCHFALYFRLPDDAKEEAASVLQEGLEKTLSQVRHLCGTIEKDEDGGGGGGGFSFVKKRDTTVKYVVKRLDTPEYPSIDDIEAATFSCRALGDLGLWGLEEMPYGEGRPESNPHNSPLCSGFQLNLVRGGAVFSSHVHHWAADLVGWSNFVRQLADNCRAIHAARVNNDDDKDDIDFPPWDPACIDVSRFVKQLAPDDLIDGPPVAPRHPGHLPRDAYQALLFHLPRSKAARLKALATPTPSSSSPSPTTSWVSTYDATCAFAWRHLTRVRIPYYADADPTGPAPWVGESVDMRPRFRDPAPPPRRMVRNMLAGGFSDAGPGLAAGPLPSLGGVAGVDGDGGGGGGGDGDGVLPLSALAGYIRRLTDSVTQARVEGLMLGYIARLRDRQSVSFNLMSKPPMSFFVTDHRAADVAGCDFGFGRPVTHRFLTGDSVSANMVLVYPPARKMTTGGGGGGGGEGEGGEDDDDDEGTVWSITMEKELVPKLLEDPEWCEYFEYRGVD